MAFLLGDIYIGDFPITQSFGARPAVYNARYNLKGHNGQDWSTPSLTLILSAADGYVSEIGKDIAGYGNYIKIVHDGYLTLYAHLNDVVVKKGDRVVAGQLIAHSNNTGFSDGPHLHFGVAPCDASGIKTDPNNGYSGYIDPMSSLCQWDIKNLTKPIDPTATEVDTKIPVPTRDFTTMVAQGSSFKVSANFAIEHGANQYLAEQGLETIDLDKKPDDPTAGERLNRFYAEKLNELSELKTKIEQTQNVPIQPQNPDEQEVPSVVVVPEATTQEQAKEIIATATPLTNLLKKLYSGIKGFIFIQQ